MSARKGPGDDDRRLHEGERRIGERLAGQLHSTTADRQDATGQAEPVGLFDVIREPAPPDLPSRVGFVVRPRDADLHAGRDADLHARGRGRRQTTGPADARAPRYWTVEAENVVMAIVSTGRTVTSDDLRERYRHEPSATGASVGALFRALARRGLLELVEHRPSNRPEARGRVVGVWRAGPAVRGSV